MQASDSGDEDPFDFLFKIILIGDSSVGKTCVVQRFKSGLYSEKQHNTIGVDFTVRSLDIEGKRVKIQVWDTAGQERFRTITQSYYRSAHGAIIAYDITGRKTFESVTHWIHEVEKFGAANIVLMLIVVLESPFLTVLWRLMPFLPSFPGNKSDLLENRQVLFEDACTLAEKHGLVAVLETSAKEALNVDEVFLLMAKELMVRNSMHLQQGSPRNSILLDSRPVMTVQNTDTNQCSC